MYPKIANLYFAIFLYTRDILKTASPGGDRVTYRVSYYVILRYYSAII